MNCLLWAPILINLQLGLCGGLWRMDLKKENAWFDGEPFILLDLIAILILIIKNYFVPNVEPKNDKNYGFKFLMRIFLFVHLVMNIDRIFKELWKLQHYPDAIMYQTQRYSIWSKSQLIFLEQNIITILLVFIGIYWN